MTLQFIRDARLLVGQPGNPARIGTPGKAAQAGSSSTTATIAGKVYPVDADGNVTVPRSVYDSTASIPLGFQGARINDDGTATFLKQSGATTTTPGAAETFGTPNTPATPGEGLDLSQMRFRFSVRHFVIQTPGTLDLTVYNLADSTASLIKREFTRVQLSAGYQGNRGSIFNGTIAFVQMGRESGTDTFLKIQAAEGDQPHNWGVINTTLAAGSTTNDRVAAVVKALAPFGITPGYIPDNLPGAALPRGVVMSGMARDELRCMAQDTGCEWSIKDDQLNFWPADQYRPGPAIVLNSRTGMVGLPEQTDQGIVVRCLLNPAIIPGRPIHIDQASVQQMPLSLNIGSQAQNTFKPRIASDGFYRVLLVQHEGDNRGQAWHTTATCIALKDPLPLGSSLAPNTVPAAAIDQQRAG